MIAQVIAVSLALGAQFDLRVEPANRVSMPAPEARYLLERNDDYDRLVGLVRTSTEAASAWRAAYEICDQQPTPPSPDRRWYESNELWFVVGFGAGIVVGGVLIAIGASATH